MSSIYWDLRVAVESTASKLSKFQHNKIPQDGPGPVFFCRFILTRRGVGKKKGLVRCSTLPDAGCRLCCAAYWTDMEALLFSASQFRRCPSCGGLKASNDFGVFGGEIGFFSGVGFEVIEPRILPEHEFPSGVADGLERVCVVVEKMIVRRFGITGAPDGPDVLAVAFAFWQLRAGEFGEGGV